MTPSTTRSRLDRRRQSASQHRRRHRRLQLELLEERRLLAANSLMLYHDALGNVDPTSEASSPIVSRESAALDLVICLPTLTQPLVQALRGEGCGERPTEQNSSLAQVLWETVVVD